MISSSLFLSFFASIFGVFPEFSSKFPPRFFEAFSFSLSFFGAPYFAIAQYGLLSPYFAIAQYGLLSPYFAIAQYGLWLRLCARALLGHLRAYGYACAALPWLAIRQRAYATHTPPDIPTKRRMRSIRLHYTIFPSDKKT